MTTPTSLQTEQRRKTRHINYEQHVVRDEVRVQHAVDFRTLCIRVLLVAGRPDRVRTIGPVGRRVRKRARQVQTVQDTQPSCGVRVSGRGVLRIPGQDARMGVVSGRASH